MNISLNEELEALVQERVRSGLYQSTGDVIREALQLLKHRDELRREIDIGIAAADRGDVRPMDMAAIKRKARGEG